jgi:hypothetical protein
LLKKIIDLDSYHQPYIEANLSWINHENHYTKIRTQNLNFKTQRILNFVGAHPKLTGILTGVGIAFVFSSVGRFFVHEALSTATNFQIDYIDKTPISNVDSHVANAFLCFCQNCAKDFAPGHEAISPGDAKEFAPGIEAKSPGDASNFAPGELKKLK